MGKKTVFARTATERKDVDVRQVFVQLPEGVDLPIGLETDVVIRLGSQ
jgi:HlyD family secretion protein